MFDPKVVLCTALVACSSAAPPVGHRASPVVDAAYTFVATLTPEQKQAVQFAFTDAAQRVRWSNFPDGAAKRAGVRWGQLSPPQRSALTTLLGSVLSPAGLAMVEEQMAADDIVKATDHGPHGGPPGGPGGPHPGGPPGERPAVNFGSDYYYVAFVGTPSETSPWMLQFGGHHLAINATIVGAKITLSPSLTGGEPLKFDKDGKHVYIVETEVKRAMELVTSLTDDERHKAVISGERIDLVLGPGHDGEVLQPEGLAGKDMTEPQRALLLAVIQARVGILGDDAAAPALARIRADLDRTYLAWWGDTTVAGNAYFRITGPTVQIEYSPQANDGDATDHAHNMYRDPTNEYGAAWVHL